ncbi:DNA repair protein RecO [Wolbachia endosymbiont of Pentalonia nigronervosa]|uniref:DNA repair protein RecO n=1 Tax=Wolbachia endosymbiont of Pentalonia nigronervosa TaxID=1301914 RepID=UPI00165FCDB4|nr:DNA repair protein RecO [Wolbachia endosymbiont of Pentalonia nigronervosa]MBD0390986.1 DNA repair protein RecO [Wolbachia endosymbiont of Pentalonia nigronervosa]
MKWQDEGVVIATKKYGDKNLILSLFTKNHGKYRGLVRSTNNKFQISNLLHVEWSAKLPENLGFFKCELIESPFHHFFHDRLKNIAVVSFAFMLEKVLPENEPCIALYNHFQYFIDVIKYNNESWQSYYLNLELSLLTQLGFRLDLSKCAATGETEDLHFISPKTGRAVSKAAGDYYANKLLPFPQMLRDVYNNNLQNSYSFEEFQLGLRVTGHFLNKYLFSQLNMELPEPRKLILSL